MSKKIYMLDSSRMSQSAARFVLRHDFDYTLVGDESALISHCRSIQPDCVLLGQELQTLLPESRSFFQNESKIPVVTIKTPFTCRELQASVEAAIEQNVAQNLPHKNDLGAIAEAHVEQAFKIDSALAHETSISQNLQAPALSEEKIEALAKKTIEEVVWEVVPKLAEALIKEEIARLVGGAEQRNS